MKPTRDLPPLERYAREFASPLSPLALQIELEVFGANVGASGYTTVDQADQLAEHLRLGAGAHLLELGSGRGWPGIYLLGRTGCRAVMTDVPFDGLRRTAGHLRQSGDRDRCSFALADGRALPFRTRRFDAVVHADVLC